MEVLFSSIQPLRSSTTSSSVADKDGAGCGGKEDEDDGEDKESEALRLALDVVEARMPPWYRHQMNPALGGASSCLLL